MSSATHLPEQILKPWCLQFCICLRRRESSETAWGIDISQPRRGPTTKNLTKIT